MNEPEKTPSLPPRLTTGLAGLDLILGGGLFRGGVYIVMGRPGTGKTIFGNQLAFHHVRGGGRVAYCTLLSETHGRLLAFLQSMTFFDVAAVGEAITYMNGYSATEADGLLGLLQVVRGAVREQRASLVVIDGMVTAAAAAPSDAAYKKFIQELQTWVELIGCTVVLLTSATGDEVRPEQTMVDGVFQLDTAPERSRRIRHLCVTKFRGSAYLEGQHSYEISSEGLSVYPRLEPSFAGGEPVDMDHEVAAFGVPGLDTMIGGGLSRGSTTMILGASGTGKSILGQHFLQDGIGGGEPVVAFGFYANRPTLIRAADERGMGFKAAFDRGLLHVLWQPSAERLLDKIGWQLLQLVAQSKARRVFVDSIEAFREAEDPTRLSGYFAVLSQELRRLRVTTVYAAETLEPFTRDLHLTVHRLSPVTQNVIFLRQLETGGALTRELTVLKTRDRAHDLRPARFEITDKGIIVTTPVDADPRRKMLRRGPARPKKGPRRR